MWLKCFIYFYILSNRKIKLHDMTVLVGKGLSWCVEGGRGVV